MPRIIDDIPGNSFANDTLVNWLRYGQATAFIGAGASIGMYGGWGDLVSFL